jgi:hypothetical protein
LTSPITIAQYSKSRFQLTEGPQEKLLGDAQDPADKVALGRRRVKERPRSCISTPPQLQQIFNEVFTPNFDQFLNNRLTAEQAAQKMQDAGTKLLT